MAPVSFITGVPPENSGQKRKQKSPVRHRRGPENLRTRFSAHTKLLGSPAQAGLNDHSMTAQRAVRLKARITILPNCRRLLRGGRLRSIFDTRPNRSRLCVISQSARLGLRCGRRVSVRTWAPDLAECADLSTQSTTGLCPQGAGRNFLGLASLLFVRFIAQKLP